MGPEWPPGHRPLACRTQQPGQQWEMGLWGWHGGGVSSARVPLGPLLQAEEGVRDEAGLVAVAAEDPEVPTQAWMPWGQVGPRPLPAVTLQGTALSPPSVPSRWMVTQVWEICPLCHLESGTVPSQVPLPESPSRTGRRRETSDSAPTPAQGPRAPQQL